MIEFVETNGVTTLDEYSSYAQLAAVVGDLRAEAATLVPRLRGRRVLMLNSTARGGGVAEMAPRLVTLLTELGVETRWAVIGSDRPEFFSLTKQLHNMIHGYGPTEITAEDKGIYDAVSRQNADALEPHLTPDDILIVHDPQPAGVGAILKERLGLCTIWRCHIGHDEHVPQTKAAWRFLREYLADYDHCVFTATEYFPDYVSGRASIIHPALDPLSHKNRELSPPEIVAALCNAGLATPHHPVAGAPFPELAERLDGSGEFRPAANGTEIGLLYRPIITQVSRWDRLKGLVPLLEAFHRLKKRAEEGTNGFTPELQHMIHIARLVLAGPDPASIQDDPEGQEVLGELKRIYMGLDPAMQRDVAILSLPMGSLQHNALMVNALQRCSSLVVQNSLREGFGLTATEAMWKRVPVLGTQAVGLRMQIRDGLDGRLCQDPEDIDGVTDLLAEMLADSQQRELWARSAQRRAYSQFSVFTQVARWIRVLAACVDQSVPIAG
jgi:trehalose synthase